MMLAVLIASFEFSGASPMNGHNFLVTRPYVDNQFSKGGSPLALALMHLLMVYCRNRTSDAAYYDSSLTWS
jgi:hypothetical protein